MERATGGGVKRKIRAPGGEDQGDGKKKTWVLGRRRPGCRDEEDRGAGKRKIRWREKGDRGAGKRKARGGGEIKKPGRSRVNIWLAEHFSYFIEEAAFVLVRLGLEIGRVA
jgi:hypothetical protein